MYFEFCPNVSIYTKPYPYSPCYRPRLHCVYLLCFSTVAAAAATRWQKQGLKVGAFGKERIVYHHDYMVHEDLGFCRFLAPEFTPEAKPDEILLEFSVRTSCVLARVAGYCF